MQFFNSQPKQPIGESTQVEQQREQNFYQSAQELGKIMIETERQNRTAYLNLMDAVEIDETGEIEYGTNPLMNKKGAKEMYVLMDKLNSKDTFLTKLTDYDVIVTINRIWVELDVLLIDNEEDWGLPIRRSRWCTIREIVMTPIIFALRRGENGLEKEFFGKIHESKDVVNQSTSQNFNKGGFWG